MSGSKHGAGEDGSHDGIAARDRHVFSGIAGACLALLAAGNPDYSAPSTPYAAESLRFSAPYHWHHGTLRKRHPEFDICKRRCTERDSLNCCTMRIGRTVVPLAEAREEAREDANRH